MTTSQAGTYRINPAARIITSIGSDLIKDVPAAIVELVKNSYDADASRVEIVFSAPIESGSNERYLRIQVIDNGHGMSRDKVTNVWMVPATSDKLVRKTSPGNRQLQGKKGIGRYAAAILGPELLLETVDNEGEKTTVVVDWRLFEEHEYLSQIEFLIETEQLEDFQQGTVLDIRGTTEQLKEWTNLRMETMLLELRKMLSPIRREVDDEFRIIVRYENFIGEHYDETMEITAFPLYDLYDYRLSGEVDLHGRANLTFENNSSNTESYTEIVPPFTIRLDAEQLLCTPIKLDIRVFDRDPDSIQNLVNKGVVNSGIALGKNETRKLLTESSGIGIYRGPFRVRPYGDPGDDWLELNRARVQNPSLKIGSDQVIGSIEIAPEEISHLEEKSARDGLKENGYFRGLREIVKQCIVQLETRRFQSRRKARKGRRAGQFSLDALGMTGLSIKVEEKLHELKLDTKSIEEVRTIIQTEQAEQTTTLQDFERLISMYQGQATLGKIIMVVQHEGRRSLGWFRNLPPIIENWISDLPNVDVKNQARILDEIISRLRYTSDEAIKLADLFKRLDPLSVKNRGSKKIFKLRRVIHQSLAIFRDELDTRGIRVTVDCDDDIEFKGWEEDFVIAYTNLIENSLYWMNTDPDDHHISIRCLRDDELIVLDYQDTGAGIAESLIESEMLFEPGFSTKSNGTGLGLAIAGEAIARNEGELKALASSNGAYFRIELKGSKQ